MQGNYSGRLSAHGGTVRLFDSLDREVDAGTYEGDPSDAQLYLRLVEAMYRPKALSGSSDLYDSEGFEYVRLKNMGPVTLDLIGARLSEKVWFDFSKESVTVLVPGESVYVVKNRAAFAAHYGEGFRIAGDFSGSLNNGEENIRLDDASGETILDFTYKGSWYPGADGAGFSLVIEDERAPWNEWGTKENWRVSSQFGGSTAQGPSGFTEWMTSFFSLQERGEMMISEGNADPDGDGRGNLEEFISGTNPRSTESVLVVDSVSVLKGLDTSVRITFRVSAGRSYTVLRSRFLTEGIWRKVVDLPTQPESGTIEVVDSVSDSAESWYYLLASPREP